MGGRSNHTSIDQVGVHGFLSWVGAHSQKTIFALKLNASALRDVVGHEGWQPNAQVHVHAVLVRGERVKATKCKETKQKGSYLELASCALDNGLADWVQLLGTSASESFPFNALFVILGLSRGGEGTNGKEWELTQRQRTSTTRST